jgi:4'-phosphopantetheinyl transferase
MSQVDSDSGWSRPPAGLTLGDDEVHVWRARVDLEPAQLARLREFLTPDELNRAARFHFSRDRERFIAGRGVLRALLGRYLNVPPDAHRFRYNPYGKPELASEQGAVPLCFNISHARGLALLAVARNRAVGVDLEYVRAEMAVMDIADRFFSAREVTTLRALPVEQWPAAFFACWTRKEAHIKAHGEGLSLPLDSFDVSLTPGEPASLLCVDGDVERARDWSLCELTPGEGYTGALAVQGRNWRLRCWQWLEG